MSDAIAVEAASDEVLLQDERLARMKAARSAAGKFFWAQSARKIFLTPF